MNSNEIQNAYVNLYTQIRKYIWPFDVIDILVDLEIESFKSFPDVMKLRELLDRLHREIQSTISDDKDLETAYSSFKKLIDDDNTMYKLLEQVREVISNDNP